MKQLLICALLLAGCCYVDACGFYLGAGTGWSDVELAITNKSAQGSATLKYSGSGPSDSLLAGFRLKLSPELFTALESHIQLSGAKLKDTDNGDEFLIKQTSSFGIAALLGKNLGDGELYGRLGLQLANYKIVDKEAGFPEDDLEADTSHSGMRLGVGSAFAFGNNTRLRMDWSRTFYNKEQYNDDKDIGFSEFLQPTETVFLIGVIRQF